MKFVFRIVPVLAFLVLAGAGCIKTTASVSNNSAVSQNNQASSLPLSPATNPAEPAPVIVSSAVSNNPNYPAPSTGVMGTPRVTVPRRAIGTADRSTVAYSNALDIYRKSGYYFQFAGCHGTPGSITMKRGVKFMIDNRDNVGHVFKFGQNTYVLGAYGFGIIATPNTLGKNLITCDGGGAATIVVAK